MIVIGFILLSCSRSVIAQTNPVPDVSNWNVVDMSRVEVRLSDCASVYLGFETDYNNPNNSRDFVRVVSRHIPVPISKCRSHNKLSFFETAAVQYANKEEQDLLAKRSGEADQFLYIQWQISEDSHTRRDVLAGDVNIWFMPAQGLPPDGNWPFFKMEKVEVEFLTENVGNVKPRNLFSGRKYEVGETYHILRVDRDDIIKMLKGDEQ